MRAIWMFHRRLVVAVALVLALAVSAGVVIVGSRHGTAVATHSGVSRSAKVADQEPPTTATGQPTPKRRATRDAPSKSRSNAELAEAETPASVAAAEATSVPAPATSAAFPSIPPADRSDPTAYAIAFATELLDTNYAAQSRAALLAWAEHEEAPNTLPGVPASVAGKALVLSLADPGLPGGTPSPTPSASQWATNAEEGVTQSVERRGGRGRSRLGPDHRRRVGSHVIRA